MTTRTNQCWRLGGRPSGEISDEDFSWSEEEVPALEDGTLLVRTVYLSLDPTNRIWMSDQDQYMEPVSVGEVMRGMAVGVVEESKHAGFAAGDLVTGLLGWQRYAVSDGTQLEKLPAIPGVPLDAYMGLLSHIGATAYFGLLELGEPKAGETVLVSAAAGAVGSLVGQLAKIQGCRVVGIAGSDEKCAWIKDELGFDAAINYKSEDVGKALDTHCEGGIDVYFDNVGGSILDAALARMNLHGRIPTCGLISTYNASEPPPGPYHYSAIVMKRLRIQGFIVSDYASRFPEAMQKLAGWLGEGKLRYRLDITEGLENAPNALRQMFAGGNIGKSAIKVSDEPAS
ncbi:NADP-dependent oxidoreductase [Haliangium ochraceum]|uniref:Alcohol dehydrogenase zinc-binding domain protein n=1 Tax=Haliangium ochraceum (strain DSM 14365 / JCM 11303 / SMP-2) TaxID=502025 RepID=D0LUJ0_HALO1|nr:NADP-dependent oxidoreductase [Haliangium ochraceum]ACY19313.1 Alcohol dehydrogenase zinc-binding domain protein [Haliangium ochraceum DSM 14365]